MFISDLSQRHQQIIQAVKARLDQAHQAELEEIEARLMADHAIKIELVRLEVENVWQAKLRDIEKERNDELEEMEQRLKQVRI